MDFNILGPIEAIDGGRPLPLAGAKQRALLGMLLLHANEVVSSDRLIDELWARDARDVAAKSLQMAVSRLRKALDAGRTASAENAVIVTRSPGYELRVDPQRLDVTRFEALVSHGRAALAAADFGSARQHFDEALGLWRGTPLADLAYESFAQAEIARLEELRLGALEYRFQAELALGHHDRIIGELEALISANPYRERLRGQLMLALYRSDRQADALQAYQNARRALVEQLGIEPGEWLHELERGILAHDPGLQLGDERAAAEFAAETTRGMFVGRDSELAELVAGLDDAFAGRGRIFLVVGEPGIGKSRLAEELIAHAAARGARVLVGRCWEAGGAPAYWPWVQSLRTYLREAPDDVLLPELGAGAVDLARSSRSCGGAYPACRRPARRRPTERASASSRPPPRCWGLRRAIGQSSWCSTTCTQRTSRRCFCSGSSRARSPRVGCSWSAPTATWIRRSGIRSALRWPSS
jgi:DNA-binding SARP family transcriptional activator